MPDFLGDCLEHVPSLPLFFFLNFFYFETKKPVYTVHLRPHSLDSPLGNGDFTGIFISVYEK